jgi:hypothetical protein
MAFTRSVQEIINYLPSELDFFELIPYEWIDNLNFALNPKDYLENSQEFINKASERFLNAGWSGDGEIELMWIPPFMFMGIRTKEFTNGIIVWHVKQQEDGISWILSPVKLPCQME